MSCHAFTPRTPPFRRRHARRPPVTPAIATPLMPIFHVDAEHANIIDAAMIHLIAAR